MLCVLAAGTLLAAVLHADQVTPKVADALQPVTLTQAELSGEIGRRIHDLIYTNYMALNLDDTFLAPFRTRPFTNNWHYIGLGKVIDAGSLFSAYTGDQTVVDRTRGLIEDIIETRDADGYIGTFKPEPEAFQNHRNWVLHDQEYLLLGLTRNWLATGNEESLQSARELGDYVITTFSKDTKPEQVCTAGLPEAFLLLYRCTGDVRYLKFAAEIRHGNGTKEIQCASLLDWRQTFDTPPAHVYVMLARCYAQTELYRYERMPSLLEMSHYMRHELLRQSGGLNVVGSASEGEHFSYTQNGSGAIGESCVTAYLLRWLDSLMRLEGDLRYGDIMERTIYNALLAAQEPAGRKLRYFTPFTGPRVYFGQDGYCCPGNFRRIMAELPQKVYYRYADNGIAVNLFTASETTVALGSGLSARIVQETDYPNSGHVVFHMTPSEETAFPLRLRIPRWCRNVTIKVNSEAPVSVLPSTTSHELSRTWKAGDTVTLELPMAWRFVKGHQMQEGKAALIRGPVVYCLGSAQNAEVLQKYPNFTGVVIDPDSLGQLETDTSVRPDGKKVTATAVIAGASDETLTFTEFVDPSGIVTYVNLLDLGKAVEDELVSDCFALNAGMTTPVITNVTVSQRWPWNRQVDIDYTLTRDDEQGAEVRVSAFDGETALSLPEDSFSGDLHDVSRGSRRIVWDPSKTVYTNQALTRFRVELAPIIEPLYMIIDLTKAADETNQIAYVYEEDLTNGLWGAWERSPVTNAGVVVESVIWTGVTTNDIYKKDKLVLRRIPAGTFTMGKGAEAKSVTFANGFYAGVFEMTEVQWWKTLGYPSTVQTPRINTSYDDLRGSTNNVPPVDWPATGSFVSPTNFIGQLRAKTGFSDFDLPTEAQWEYLCRAGTTTYYNDGDATAPDDGVSLDTGASNTFINVLGWYRYNEIWLHTGGLKKPNAWGLYDTHGNVWEWCRDRNNDSTLPCVIRGGSWNAQAFHCCPEYRVPQLAALISNNLGFRLVRTMQ